MYKKSSRNLHICVFAQIFVCTFNEGSVLSPLILKIYGGKILRSVKNHERTESEQEQQEQRSEQQAEPEQQQEQQQQKQRSERQISALLIKAAVETPRRLKFLQFLTNREITMQPDPQSLRVRNSPQIPLKNLRLCFQ